MKSQEHIPNNEEILYQELKQIFTDKVQKVGGYEHLLPKIIESTDALVAIGKVKRDELKDIRLYQLISQSTAQGPASQFDVDGYIEHFITDIL